MYSPGSTLNTTNDPACTVEIGDHRARQSQHHFGGQAVRGGTIILACECREGVPPNCSYEQILHSGSSPEEVLAIQAERRKVRVENSVRDYVVRLARATRENSEIELGASPRAAMALFQAAQAWAGIQGRDFVIPDDVKRLAVPVFAHRVVVSSRVALANRGIRVTS